MNTKKLTNIVLISVGVFLSLHFFILPGLGSDSFIVNLISLTSFFFLVIMVTFGSNPFSNRDDDEAA